MKIDGFYNERWKGSDMDGTQYQYTFVQIERFQKVASLGVIELQLTDGRNRDVIQ